MLAALISISLWPVALFTVNEMALKGADVKMIA